MSLISVAKFCFSFDPTTRPQLMHLVSVLLYSCTMPELLSLASVPTASKPFRFLRLNIIFLFSCPKRTPSRVFSQLRLCFFLPSPVYPPWLSLSLPIYFTLHKGRSGISALPGIYTFPAPPGIPSLHILLFRLSHISM